MDELSESNELKLHLRLSKWAMKLDNSPKFNFTQMRKFEPGFEPTTYWIMCES